MGYPTLRFFELGSFSDDSLTVEQIVEKAPQMETIQVVLEAELLKAADRAARKTKQADLEKAQSALRELLTPRQEAIATINGLL